MAEHLDLNKLAYAIERVYEMRGMKVTVEIVPKEKSDVKTGNQDTSDQHFSSLHM